MKNKLTYCIASMLCIALMMGCASMDKPSQESDPVLSFINMKFGMFIHFGMTTYQGHGGWAKWGVDPKELNPTEVDCAQWAKAAKSAQMQYAVFTTKHHDGFCLWDSSVTEYDIANSLYEGDLVEDYVSAFRAEGIKIGLYFSVWDRQHEIAHDQITPEKIQFTKDQLTELLTNYGKIECIVIDGWGSKWGTGPNFVDIPYATLADHIHSLQPDCLVINHSCRTDLDVTQIVHYEATHGQHCPIDNTIPSQQGPTLQPKWFWVPGYENGPLKPTEEVIKELNYANARVCNYLLNVAPNDKGLLDDNVVQRLKEIGEAVKLSEPLEALPAMQRVHHGVKVTCSSESNADHAAENILDANLYTRWQAAPGDEQPWVEIDYGKPMTFNRLVCNEYRRRVGTFKLEAWIDGKWQPFVEGGAIKNHFKAEFNDVTAQKFRFTILTSLNRAPEIGEVTLVCY